MGEWDLKWQEKYMGVSGWYWVYQELDSGFGTYLSLYLIEEERDIPLYAKAFYGPVEAPKVPDNFVSEYYKKAKP